MQLFLIFLIVFLFFLVVWLMGTAFLKVIKADLEDAIFVGFFIYFSLFELVAFPLIMTLKPLSVLVYIWLAIIAVVCTSSALIIRKKIFLEKVKNLRKNFSVSYLIMVGLLLAQTCYMLIHSQNGWDAAAYITNVVQAVDTDTMYVYMGGRKSPNIYVRYAISSFYMHDAVLAKVFGIHAAVICRWFNTVICSVFSALIVYKIGKIIFQKKEMACNMVSAWVIANFGVSTIYFANAFLMMRAYEGKAFCGNIIIPAVICVFLKIYKESGKKVNWIELFWINMASVAISSSSLAVVPVLNGCLFFGHLAVGKRIKDTGKIVLCLLPSVFYFIIYAAFQYGNFKVIIP